MLSFVWTVAIIVCVIGWVKNHVGLLVICYYMQTKGYTPPSEEEMKACSTAVIKRLLGRKGRTGP